MFKNLILKTFAKASSFPRVSKLFSTSRASLTKWVVRNKNVILGASATAATSSIVTYAINSVLNENEPEQVAGSSPSSKRMSLNLSMEKAFADIRHGLSTTNSIDNTKRQAALIKGLLHLGVIIGENPDEETSTVGLEAIKMMLPCASYSILPTTLDTDDVALAVLQVVAQRSVLAESSLTALVEMAENGIIRN